MAADADAKAAGLFLAEEGHQLPHLDHPDYLDELLRLCEKASVHALFPTFSGEIELIAANADRFRRAGVGLLLPNPSVIRKANDKFIMSEFVRKIGIQSPPYFDEKMRWPGVSVVMKERHGSGSSGMLILENEEDWNFYRRKYPSRVFQKFISGQEYTVDVLCDRTSACVVCSPRSRLKVKAGQSVRGQTVQHELLDQQTRKICQHAGLVGPANLQFIDAVDGPHFIELNPRFAAGGLMLTIAAGGNIPLLALQIMAGEAVAPVAARPGVLMTRYWEEHFVLQ
jgi:carbamoyl-phosphate synthase large subunit